MRQTLKFLPIIIGVFLGACSIIMGQIPTVFAWFTGMTVVGTHMGYLWGSLIAAWVFNKKWKSGFLASYLALTIANLVYYGTIVVFYVSGLGRSPFPPTPLQSLLSFVLWSILSAIVCALAATAVWLAWHAKSKLFNRGIFVAAYIGLLGVIFFWHVLPTINWFTVSREGDFFVAYRLSGRLFEIGFAFVVTTALLVAGLKTIVKSPQDSNN